MTVLVPILLRDGVFIHNKSGVGHQISRKHGMTYGYFLLPEFFGLRYCIRRVSVLGNPAADSGSPSYLSEASLSTLLGAPDSGWRDEKPQDRS